MFQGIVMESNGTNRAVAISAHSLRAARLALTKLARREQWDVASKNVHQIDGTWAVHYESWEQKR